MYRTPIAIAVCLLIAPYTVAETPTAHQSDDPAIEKVLGFWEIAKGVNQGEELSEKELDGVFVHVKRYMMITYDRDQNEKYRASFTIDESESPMQIDLLSMVKGRPPAKSLGIIQIEKGQWKICYALPGQPRPTRFESTAADGTMLFIHSPKEQHED